MPERSGLYAGKHGEYDDPKDVKQVKDCCSGPVYPFSKKVPQVFIVKTPGDHAQPDNINGEKDNCRYKVDLNELCHSHPLAK
jgi:hypothetical protein